MPMVLPKISPCGEPPAGWCPAHDPARNFVTLSKSRSVRASSVIITYSAIAGSWPNTLHRVMPRGNDVPAPAHHALGPARTVRRDDDVRQLVERVTRAAPVGLGRGRVLPPHVERGAADLALAQRGIDRILLDDLAARDVDQGRGWL